jgi:Undecaprenyl-phosphate galactose phosphotransferase WbaP
LVTITRDRDEALAAAGDAEGEGCGVSVAAARSALQSLPTSSVWGRITHVLVLAIGDVTAITVSLGLAYLFWAKGELAQPIGIYQDVWSVLPIFPLAFGALGLYPGLGLGPVETLRRLWLGTTGSFVLLGALVFALKLPQVYSRFTLGLAWLGCLVLLPLVRSGIAAAAGRRWWWGEPVVTIGRGSHRDEVVRQLLDHPAHGYRPVAVLDRGDQPSGGDVDGVPILGGIALAPELARRGITLALLVQDEFAPGPLGTWLQTIFRHVVLLRGMRELPVERVEARNFGGMLGLAFSNQLLRRRNQVVKRALDIVFGSLALVLALPVIGFAALSVKLSSRGPAFFRQEREGQGGRRILIRKVRTMRIDAEKRLGEYLDHDPEARRQWELRFKLADDPRVIPGVGTFLRRFSIDELPQLVSVVIGEMSLVGPRPFPDYHLERFSDDFRQLRRRVRPGLTGLWQITVRSGGTVTEQVQYDTYYVTNWSVWLDLYIMARTLGAVVSGRGAS